MFERFTKEARAVVVGAQAQARRLGHNYIGTEHLLLSLVAGEDQTAALLRARGLPPDRVESTIRRLLAGAPGSEPLDREALAAIGIDLDHVLDRIETLFGSNALAPIRSRRRRRWRRSRSCPTPGERGHIPFTPRSKKCLELSLREAIRLGDGNIGTEHLALGLTRMNEGLSGQIMTVLGVSPRALHAELLDRRRRAG